MGQEDRIHLTPSDAYLCQSLVRAAADVEDQGLTTGLNQDARAELSISGMGDPVPSSVTTIS